MAKTAKLIDVTTTVGRIALKDEGEGVPVLFWPSLFSDHRLFDYVVALLPHHAWRVLRVDGPGFGKSDPPQGEVQPDVYADVVFEILDSLGIQRAFVVGCSWGGQIAVHAGVRATERVAGVLAMNTPLDVSRGAHTFEVFGTRWLGSTRFWGNGVARSMFSSASRKAHPERVEKFASAFSDFDSIEATTTVKTVMTRFSGLGDVLPRLQVPTRILMGAEDRLYPVERMLPLASRAPSAKIDIIPSCGHLAPMEAPEAVVEALKKLSSSFTS